MIRRAAALAMCVVGLSLRVMHCCPALAQTTPGGTGPIKIKLRVDGHHHVMLHRLEDGSLRYVLDDGDGEKTLTPEQFAEMTYHDYVSRPAWQVILNISEPLGIAWVALGFLGQALFTGRMVVQWLVSEKSRRSVIPVAFWWMSLGGGVMLLTYFIWRKDIVGVMGQSVGVFIYTRNLILIARHGGAEPHQHAADSGTKIESATL